MKPNSRLPNFFERLLAAIIDSTLLESVNWGLKAIVMLILTGLIKKAGADPTQVIDGVMDMGIEIGLYFLISFPYFVWGNFKYGTTLGKLPFRIFVRDHETGHSITLKQSILRYVGYGVSYLPMFAGYLMIPLQKDRRGLHDLIASTQCVVEKKIHVIRIEDVSMGEPARESET